MLKQLIELEFIGGLIEWSYNAIVWYYVVQECSAANFPGKVAAWWYPAAASYLGYLLLISYWTYSELKSRCEGRCVNMVYHTVMGLLVPRILQLEAWNLLLCLPLALLLPASLLLGVVTVLLWFCRGLMEDCKRLNQPVRIDWTFARH